MLSKVLIFVLVVFALIIMYTFVQVDSIREKYTSPYISSPEHEAAKWSDMHSLKYPTKCVSCEHVFPNGERWRGQQTKCFSCEKMAEINQREMRKMIHPQDTHPLKLFTV